MNADSTHPGHGGHSGHESAAGSGPGEERAPAHPMDQGGHAGHAATPALSEGVQRMQARLKQLRVQQAALDRERARELEEQRRHDAEAQRLMDTDPRGHIEMMRPLQERKALVRELPPALLAQEAALYLQIERAVQAEQEAQGREPGPRPAQDILMAWHVLGEHWAHIAVMPLGAWLIFSPVALAYQSAALTWSDIISGVLVIAFAILSMALRPWAPWANALVGLWVAFAPLLFWAPTSAEYANETLVGTLVAAFSVIIPMRTEMPGPEVPPGWTYSPSSWPQRAPIVGLAVMSFFLARYMAAFQLGHIPAAWDPIFGGTETVLTSEVSRAFPVSDAGLGAYTYILEVLSGLMGDSRRWRTMPWMVAMFGIVVVPLGMTSIVLIMLQPVAVGAWCTICLLTAIFMLAMVVLSLDELVAMVQFLILGRRAGKSTWRLFWAGGDLPRPVEDLGLSRRPAGFWTEMFWGAGLPWTLAVSAVLGAWVMAAPWVFGTTGTARTLASIFGALAVVIAFTAMAEVTRAARFLNVAIGLGIALAPWVFPAVSLAARLSDLAAGLLLIALGIPRGAVWDRYSTWDPFII